MKEKRNRGNRLFGDRTALDSNLYRKSLKNQGQKKFPERYSHIVKMNLDRLSRKTLENVKEDEGK